MVNTFRMSFMCVIFFVNICCVLSRNSIMADIEEMQDMNMFSLLLQEITVKSLQPYKCVVILADTIYVNIFERTWFRRFGIVIPFIVIIVDESADLYSPNDETQQSLLTAKREGCQLYIILIANGIQVTRLLQFGDRYRYLNTLSKYILLFDNRLFEKALFYLWKRIINVVFVKKYAARTMSGQVNSSVWYEISTVPFPAPISTVLIPWRLDIWAQSKFRKGAALFRDKTSDLQNHILKVVAFPHIPGVTKTSETFRDILSKVDYNESTKLSGTEIEILQVVSKAMNFRCEIYERENADVELWGRKLTGGLYTGIIGEMISTRADIALGDLYYTPYLLDLMDLSVPYNTECLTFLTPESQTDNSWKTLILPFKSIMWAAVLISLIICMLSFHFLARFHIHITKFKQGHIKNISEPGRTLSKNKKRKVITLSMYPELKKMDPNVKYTLMKEKYNVPRLEGDPVGLYQFSEPVNSVLYTYSMLLLVSLPKLPTGWSLRMLTGWYWLYCLLLVTSYRASMTAILAQPAPKLKIDTVQDLVTSKLTYSGWGEINSEFFKSFTEAPITIIAENFVIVNDSEQAVDRVAEGSTAFYENTYFLKEALVKRQQRVQCQSSGNGSQSLDVNKTVAEDRSLHIMSDCIINMPVSIGLQKNSPFKPRMDRLIRMVLEAGLIKKWLDDVMQNVLNAEIHKDNAENSKALMNMKKFSGALAALLIGYCIGIIALIGETIYFNVIVKNKPNFNKYSKCTY